jgi:hypothetical protein
VIPEFDERGCLPPGEHAATWDELTERFGGNSVRQKLLEGLARVIPLLQHADCSRLWLNGSFITTKEEPADIDACYDRCDISRLDLRLYPVHGLQRREQKRDFGCEVFPAEAIAELDSSGLPCSFRNFFQKDRNESPKGIIELSLK